MWITRIKICCVFSFQIKHVQSKTFSCRTVWGMLFVWEFSYEQMNVFYLLSVVPGKTCLQLNLCLYFGGSSGYKILMCTKWQFNVVSWWFWLLSCLFIFHWQSVYFLFNYKDYTQSRPYQAPNALQRWQALHRRLQLPQLKIGESTEKQTKLHLWFIFKFDLKNYLLDNIEWI